MIKTRHGHMTPVVVANKPNLNNWPEQTLNKAKGLCKQSNGIPAAECMIYVCFGGPGFAGQEAQRVFMFLCACVLVCLCACVFVFLCVYVFVSLCACVFVCMFVCP